MTGRLTRFLISGGSAAGVEYLVFILLQMTLGKSWVLASQTVSFACGFIVSFLLNRSWVFRSSGDMKPELLKYILVAGINLFKFQP